MKRTVVLGVLLALGALAAVTAQQPPANAPKVIDVEKVKDNLYVLRGGGGNTAVFITANGVTVVDAKNPGWGQPILDKMTIGTGADQVDLYYFGRGHTNGDAFVVFPALRVAHSGDIFAGKSVPLIDASNGGSMSEISDSLMKAYNGIKNVDTIINGHAA